MADAELQFQTRSVTQAQLGVQHCSVLIHLLILGFLAVSRNASSNEIKIPLPCCCNLTAALGATVLLDQTLQTAAKGYQCEAAAHTQHKAIPLKEAHRCRGRYLA